jgi:hypothetical protein
MDHTRSPPALPHGAAACRNWHFQVRPDIPNGAIFIKGEQHTDVGHVSFVPM